MKTWNDYKEFIRSADLSAAHDLDIIEEQARYIGAILDQRSTDSHKNSERSVWCAINRSFKRYATYGKGG